MDASGTPCSAHSTGSRLQRRTGKSFHLQLPVRLECVTLFPTASSIGPMLAASHCPNFQTAHLYSQKTPSHNLIPTQTSSKYGPRTAVSRSVRHHPCSQSTHRQSRCCRRRRNRLSRRGSRSLKSSPNATTYRLQYAKSDGRPIRQKDNTRVGT